MDASFDRKLDLFYVMTPIFFTVYILIPPYFLALALTVALSCALEVGGNTCIIIGIFILRERPACEFLRPHWGTCPSSPSLSGNARRIFRKGRDLTSNREENRIKNRFLFPWQWDMPETLDTGGRECRFLDDEHELQKSDVVFSMLCYSLFIVLS